MYMDPDPAGPYRFLQYEAFYYRIRDTREYDSADNEWHDDVFTPMELYLLGTNTAPTSKNWVILIEDRGIVL